jgi:Zn finger protein HypA/HybF involved in hydrogenase expression
MGKSLTDTDVEKVVISKGDTFVEYRPAKGTGKNGKKSSNQYVTFICGICTSKETMGYGPYKRCTTGACKRCRNKKQGDNQRNTDDEIKEAIESRTNITVVKFDGLTITMTCGEHTFQKTFHAFRQKMWCPECAKTNPSIRVKINMSIDKRNKNTGDETIETKSTLVMPNGYKLMVDAKNTILIKCSDNHVFKQSRDNNVECPYHNITEKQLQGRRIHKHVVKEIYDVVGDVVLSTYVDKTGPLEIQCNTCDTIFYKSLNLYISKSSRCPNCSNTKKQIVQSKQNLENGLALQEKVELENWTWCDDTTRYQDQNTKFSVICPKEHEQNICRLNFDNGGRRCCICANKTKSENSKIPLDEVKEICLNSGFELLNDKYYGTNANIAVKCMNCFNKVDISFDTMRRGRCPKCNSSKSSGEIRIEKTLNKNSNVLYVEDEATFDNYHQLRDDWFCCKDKKVLRFDFKVVLTDETELFIEYDGKQHFTSIEFFGGIDSFKKRRNHDLIKTLYCDYNNLYLLRISYRDFKNTASIVNKYIHRLMIKKLPQYLAYSNENDYQDFKKDYLYFEPPENLP